MARTLDTPCVDQVDSFDACFLTRGDLYFSFSFDYYGVDACSALHLTDAKHNKC
jgi:hypothetical protein